MILVPKLRFPSFEVRPRSQTPVWERAFTKLCFANPQAALGRPRVPKPELGDKITPSPH